ncbi:30S ribosomal protein S19 [Gammaproteobacteria bacterium]|jgi:small subunit ribosomal protein S19|nr:30S ribosomal protein S19 [Gammaproteobacteria bacterium]
MPRSRKKGPFVAGSLLKAVEKANQKGNNRQPIKAYSRASEIIAKFIGFTFLVHNGKQFISVFITDKMLGKKLGEFSMTRNIKRASSAKVAGK